MLADSSKFLPPYLQTVANKRFLGSTLDLLINQPALTRFNGFIGHQIYNGQLLSGNYLLESTPSRQYYQLEAAFVTKDDNQNIVEITNFIDLLNSSANKGSITNSWNRLLTGNSYSWQGFNNLDKIINYQNYCWMSLVSSNNDWYWNNNILIKPENTVAADILGQVEYTDTNDITILNGMIITFPSTQEAPYNTNKWIVDGVGNEISLIPIDNILLPNFVKAQNNAPDYITIAREAIDLNLWSRTNLWVHKNTLDSIITILALRNPEFSTPTTFQKAIRPIIEFASLELFNSGKIGLEAVTYFDDYTPDAFSIVQGQTNFVVDGFQLNTGDSVIFNADHNQSVRQNIYDVNFIDTSLSIQIPRRTPVQAVAASNILLKGSQTVDGYNTQPGDRILVWGQNNSTENGIYVSATSVWTRVEDFSNDIQFGVLVLTGTVYGQKYFIYTPENIIANPILGTLNGIKDGYNTTFTLPLIPDPKSLMIWNNFPLVPNVGYTISGATITFTNAPQSSDSLAFQAWPLGASPVGLPFSGIPVGIQNGFNKNFELPVPPNEGTWLIWNNFPLIPDSQIGYTIIGSTITFTNAPQPSDNLYYQFWSRWTNDNNPPVLQLVFRETAQAENCTLITNGNNFQDKMVVWDDTLWYVASQNKTAINQAPLFDIFDLAGLSYGNNEKYLDSSFVGSKLFSYQIGTGLTDPVLGFPLTYGVVGNLNDVIFDNNYLTDTFSYTNVKTAVNILNGRAHLISPITLEESVFDAWQYINSNLELYQNYISTGTSTITFAGTLLQKATPNSQATQVFLNGTLLAASDFTVTENNGIITINVNVTGADTGTILIKILCSTPIAGGWYDVPPAFDHNPMGQFLSTFNMGELRMHSGIAQNNADDTVGPVDLMLKKYQGVPGNILVQEAISLLPSLLFCNKQFDIDSALRTASEDYTLFKQKFINTLSQLSNVSNLTAKQAVDQTLQKIASSFIPEQPWATSDMCYWGGTPHIFTVTNTHATTFTLTQTYNWNTANSQSVQVYINNQQLVQNRDYSINGNVLTFLLSLSIGDSIAIYEIADTTGSFIPATPTKLGLAAAYIPQIYNDYTYQTERQVLQGHDGSITTCYGDYRDTFLLEYELRVYNNLKVNNQFLFDTIQTHVPDGGRWRSELASTNLSIAPYTPSELLNIQQRMFYEWAAEYNVNYINSFYNVNDLFTWNWSSSLDRLSDQESLLGYWRGIYRWFYDSENVNTRPWEMLGLSIKPIWWDTTYGPAPYTGTNNVLWNDIELGIIRDPAGNRMSSYGPKTANIGSILSVIPVDSAGNLMDPNLSVVGVYNAQSAQYDFLFGDGGPTEEAWRRSSAFPFAKLRAQILQNPLFMCGMLWDTNNYLPTNNYNEFRYDGNYLASINQVVLNSIDNNGSARVNSLLNYSIESLRRQGQNPNILRTAINNTTVQLMYPLGGFSDANNLVAYGSPNNPADVGAAELIPVQDYQLFLNESTPTGTLNYSGLIINQLNSGEFQISGYNRVNPFFIIYPAQSYGPFIQIGVTPNFYKYPTTFLPTTEVIPYNTTFADVQSVINFIAGYDKFLTSNGLTFEINDLQTQIDWQTAAIQFIKWSLTDWKTTIPLSLVLNPATSILNYEATSGTLYNLTDSLTSLVLDASGVAVEPKYLDVYRDANNVTITHQGGGIFGCLSSDIINYEHRLVFDNETAFSDTIYDPVSGIRQIRLQLSGQKSANWNGTLDSPGFLICAKLIQSWTPNQDYLFGTVVQWKTNNYVATQDIIGSATFQYNQFRLISTVFTNSILPNLSLKAADYTQSYNINYRPFLEDLINLRNNTIGYIDRDWLSILDIDLGAQTSFYKGWIKEKGTLNSLTSYGRGSTPQLNTAIGVNEEYAMKVGVYGSDLRTGYGDVALPPIVNTQNPLVISFVSTPSATTNETIQITPNKLYEKSVNWTNDFAQTYGNLELTQNNFLSAGPVIPQQLVNEAKNMIPDFSPTDEPSLFFTNTSEMIMAPQDSVLKIVENGGSFWLENNQLAPGPNQWDVITYNPVTTGISTISQPNANSINFILTTNINAIANSIVAVDYVDTNANLSISGTFIVSDYIISPFVTANSIGYSSLTLTTLPNQFGNIFLNYSTPVITSDIFIPRSLRANSIAEGIILSTDRARYVVDDSVGEAAYTLLPPFQNEITYGEVPNGIAINSLAYDSPNEILWSGKPEANFNAFLNLSTGLVDMRVVGITVSPTGIESPTLATTAYILPTKHPNTKNLGMTVVCGNNFAAASADNINGPGQIYIFKNVQQKPTINPQILSGDITTSNCSISTLAMSADANWLYAGIQLENSETQIGVYALENSPNVSESWWPNYNSVINLPSITVDHDIPNAFAITISVFDELNFSSRLLIPDLEYSVSGSTITILAGGTNINVANYATTITGINSFYTYQGTIIPLEYNLANYAGFGTSISCDALGKTLAVGAPDSGKVIIFNRIVENQYTPIPVGTTVINTVNPFSTITSTLINGIPVTPDSVTIYPTYVSLTFTFIKPQPDFSTLEIEGFCFCANQVISAPNINDASFGSSLAIQNNQLVVGSMNTSTNFQYKKGAAYVYALDSSITSTKIIPLSDLSLSTTPFMINDWVITPLDSTIIGLVNAINIMSGYTGVSASTADSELILTINPNFHTTGIGFLGA